MRHTNLEKDRATHVGNINGASVTLKEKCLRPANWREQLFISSVDRFTLQGVQCSGSHKVSITHRVEKLERFSLLNLDQQISGLEWWQEEKKRNKKKSPKCNLQKKKDVQSMQ